jgi:spermidine synthase
VSGGLGETLTEVYKYNPSHIDYVELDPMLTEVALNQFILREAPSLNIINMDGRSYIKKTKKTYDAIIIDLPEPDTFQINRFFTSEFFFLAKKILKKKGVLSISMEYSPHYISDIRRKKFSTLYHTARLYFRNMLVLPGEEAYFICRDGKLWEDIPARLTEKSIIADYLGGSFYGNVTEERVKQLEASLDRTERVNTDFNPNLISMVFYQWFMKHGASPHYFLFAFGVMIVIYLILIRKQEYVLFSTGLAAMGVEMLVIFAFQVVYGYIYLKIGVIITVFLVGLLPGALMGNLRKLRGGMFDLIVSELLLLFLLALFYFWAACLRIELHSLYYMVYGFLFSFVCGFQFPIVAGIIGEKESPAAGCLAADLAGAAVGTLITGTILIPLRGIEAAVIFLIIIKISSVITVFWFQKRN